MIKPTLVVPDDMLLLYKCCLMKAIVLLKVVVEMLLDTSRAMARSDLLGYAANIKDDDDVLLKTNILNNKAKLKQRMELEVKRMTSNTGVISLFLLQDANE